MISSFRIYSASTAHQRSSLKPDATWLVSRSSSGASSPYPNSTAIATSAALVATPGASPGSAIHRTTVHRDVILVVEFTYHFLRHVRGFLVHKQAPHRPRGVTTAGEPSARPLGPRRTPRSLLLDNGVLLSRSLVTSDDANGPAENGFTMYRERYGRRCDGLDQQDFLLFRVFGIFFCSPLGQRRGGGRSVWVLRRPFLRRRRPSGGRRLELLRPRYLRDGTTPSSGTGTVPEIARSAVSFPRVPCFWVAKKKITCVSHRKYDSLYFAGRAECILIRDCHRDGDDVYIGATNKQTSR